MLVIPNRDLNLEESHLGDTETKENLPIISIFLATGK
jgi:hypothetical protein